MMLKILFIVGVAIVLTSCFENIFMAQKTPLGDKKITDSSVNNIVELSFINESDGDLLIALKNGRENPIFFIYDPEALDKENTVFVPYNLECHKVGQMVKLSTKALSTIFFRR